MPANFPPTSDPRKSVKSAFIRSYFLHFPIAVESSRSAAYAGTPFPREFPPAMAPPQKSPAAAQPPRWQSIATVLLILHFFCLGVGVAVNMGGGKSLLGQ